MKSQTVIVAAILGALASSVCAAPAAENYIPVADVLEKTIKSSLLKYLLTNALRRTYDRPEVPSNLQAPTAIWNSTRWWLSTTRNYPTGSIFGNFTENTVPRSSLRYSTNSRYTPWWRLSTRYRYSTRPTLNRVNFTSEYNSSPQTTEVSTVVPTERPTGSPKPTDPPQPTTPKPSVLSVSYIINVFCAVCKDFIQVGKAP